MINEMKTLIGSILFTIGYEMLPEELKIRISKKLKEAIKNELQKENI